MKVPTIQSERLDLVSMAPAFLRASLEGRLDEAAASRRGGPVRLARRRERVLRWRLDELTVNPGPALARPRHRAARAGAKMIGRRLPRPARTRTEGRGWLHRLAGVPSAGIAQEAVEALFAWAEREHGIRHFVASVGPWKKPSLGLVRKPGFVQTEYRWTRRMARNWCSI